MGSAKQIDVKIQFSNDGHQQLQDSGLTLMEAYGLWLWHNDKATQEPIILPEAGSPNYANDTSSYK